MKRLRDVEDGSPLLQDAQRLLKAAAPTVASKERMQRVRRAIDEREAAPAGIRGRPLPALATALGVLLMTGSALAAVRWYTHRPDRSAVESAPTQDSATQRSAPSDNAAAAHMPTDRARSTPKRARPSTPRTRQEPEATVIEPSRDSALVHQAMTALRRDHDAATAARLLSEQRTAYPESPLAEEALSLHIEAAVASEDPRAGDLAALYMVRYPNGRYVAIATRALKSARR